MKSFWSAKKLLLTAFFLLFALSILKIVLVLTAKPKITVDYVAEYNRITRPANYDPNENAAPYYQKAFDAFIEMPEDLRNPYINWPTDFNSTEQDLLENWLASNSQAFEFFQIAANKPYYWLERYTDEDNNMLLFILFHDLKPLKHLSEALLWNAKLVASKGRPQIAFENIIDCYKAGYQKCRTPTSAIEQLAGMRLKKVAVDSTLLILNRKQVDSSDLKLFQYTLQEQLDKDAYTLDFEVEKMVLYDILQMTFVDNSRGTGRLSCTMIKYFQTMCGWEENLKLTCKLLFNCFFGLTRNDMVIRIEEKFASFDVLKTKTPWQLHKDDPAYFERSDMSYCDNCDGFVLADFFPPTYDIFNSYYKVKTDGKALLAVLAILRFKADNHRLPAALVELTDTGYLKCFPMDPYSDGPLVYKPAGDSFKLYSVGEDLVDDGGSNEVKTRQGPRLREITFGTGLRSPDIVYWPVKELKDLMHKPTPK